MTSTSYISENGNSYVGSEAVDVFRVKLLVSGLKMYAKCGMIPTRGMTITKMLAWAGQYTGKKYKRTQIDLAVADLIERTAPIEKALKRNDNSAD